MEQGRADRITLGLRYSNFKSSQARNGVLITLREGYENPAIWDKHLKQESWREVIDNPGLGLREYYHERYNGAWGYISYEVMNDGDRTPKGSLIRYRCADYPIGEVDECHGSLLILLITLNACQKNRKYIPD